MNAEHEWGSWHGMKCCKVCGVAWNAEGPDGDCEGSTELGQRRARTRTIADACRDGERGDELFDRISYLDSL